MAEPAARAPSAVTPDLVRHVARLSRLTVSEAQLPKLTAEIESILGYVAKIDQADVAGVEPMAHALPLHNVFREDVPRAALPREKVLENAPETDGPFFKVPKVIGGDEDSAG
jgi:aspartyl-tRNA(Asn)/glutamyl-tRNA(Gln) amidotransferase subunit C